MSRNTVAKLSQESFGRQLQDEGVGIQIGPFNTRLQVEVESIAPSLYSFYGEYPLLPPDAVYSIHARFHECRGFPRFYRRMVRALVDGRRPHPDMPVDQALPVLEWGLNLVIALRSHCFLMLHSAVLERNGHALLLPASPGHGKTTLCAGLSYYGWRTLSDEFGLVRPMTRQMIPVPRPMALKNESIAVIRSLAPEALIGSATPNTRKGTVAHAIPAKESISRQAETAPAQFIVFPRWVPEAAYSLAPLSKGQAFVLLAANAFNYELLGESAFSTVRDLVDHARCYQLVYSDLEDAVGRLTELSDQNAS